MLWSLGTEGGRHFPAAANPQAIPCMLHGFAPLRHGCFLTSTVGSSSGLGTFPRLAAKASSLSCSPPESSRALQQMREMGLDECFTTLLQNQTPSALRGSLEKIGLLLEEGVTVQQLNLLVRSHRFLGARHFFQRPLPRLESYVAFLKSVQVEKQALGMVLIRQPIFLSMRVEGLEGKVKLLQSLGIERKDIGRAVLKHPRIFTLSSQTLEQRLGFWKEIGLQNTSICRMIRVYPEMLCLDCGLKMKPLLELFESYGFSKDVISTSIFRYPRCLKSTMESLSRNMELLQQLGFNRSSKKFMVASFSLACRRTELLESRFQGLISYGFSVEDAKLLVRRCPTILTKKTESIEKVLDYIQTVLKRDVREVLAFPPCLSYSLEKRMKPRFAILAERQMQHNLTIQPSLSYMLSCTDDAFQERLRSPKWNAGFTIFVQKQEQ